MHAFTWIRHTAAAVLLAVSASAWAQTVYRCGNLYSDAPCAGASTFDASDTRSPQQKAQTDAAARQSAALAGRLERERHALERAHRKAAAPAQPLQTAPAQRPAARPAAAGKPQTEPFTAIARGRARPTGNTPGKPPPERPAAP